MSLGACLPDLIASGKIAKGQGKKAQRAYDRHFARLRHEMSPEAAAAQASEAALRELEYAAALTKRQAMLQVTRQQGMLKSIAWLQSRGDGFYSAVTKVIASGAGANVMNIERQYQAIIGRAHARMNGVIARHSRNLLGEARDKTGLRDLVRERFGEDTGNTSARELAEAFGDAAEMVRGRFNKAGGNIAKRSDWGLPQTHDMMKVRMAGATLDQSFAIWRAAVAPRLAVARMIDNETGQPFTADGLEVALRGVFDSIVSDGWNKRATGSGGGRGKLANQRQDSRFLVFKSADDWIAYQEQFGTGNAFDSMMAHIDGMARDTATMEVMGPNPEASLRWLQDTVRNRAAIDPDVRPGVLDRARGANKSIGDLYDVVTGKLNTPVNQVAARTFGGVRSFLTASLLGSATLSAVTDTAFQAVTRAYNGMPITGALTGYLKLLNPANAADRQTAVRLGLIADEASKMAASLNRFVDGTHGPETMRRLSDAVLRVSGLSPWTQAGKWAFGMETLGHLHDVRSTAFADLDTALRGMMDRYGIDAAGWDTIRATKPYEATGAIGTARFLRPDDVADEGLGDAMLRMVLTETDYAVPSVTARARATLSFGQQPGTLGGEIIRNAALFKSFGVNMILTHGARMMEGSMFNRAKYFAGLTITTTLLGALASQLKEIAQGRDAKDMTTAEFWGGAVLQGGGYGIFGDFLKGAGDENRFGGGFAETLAGPVVGLAGDVARSVVDIGGEALDPEEDVNAGDDAIKMLKRYMPGGSLWYARAAYNRLVLDRLQSQIDPNYDQSWQRMEDAAADEGQDYYWRPGEFAPDRAPVMAEAPE